MATEKPTYQDRIIQDPKILVGKPVIKGTRIPVSLILNLLANGADNKEIKADYPDLTDEDIQAAIAYAADRIDREANEPLPRSL
jgi:uncharacterized protein (DUF433 family)